MLCFLLAKWTYVRIEAGSAVDRPTIDLMLVRAAKCDSQVQARCCCLPRLQEWCTASSRHISTRIQFSGVATKEVLERPKGRLGSHF